MKRDGVPVAKRLDMRPPTETREAMTTGKHAKSGGVFYELIERPMKIYDKALLP
jgi:hypothetical protein